LEDCISLPYAYNNANYRLKVGWRGYPSGLFVDPKTIKAVMVETITAL
jgi:hypothetical protein